MALPYGSYLNPISLGLGVPISPEERARMGLSPLGSAGSTGGLGGLGGFGLSNIRVGMSGEVERARLDILERMKRTTDSRAKSRLTLPKLFGEGETKKSILADVL